MANNFLLSLITILGLFIGIVSSAYWNILNQKWRFKVVDKTTNTLKTYCESDGKDSWIFDIDETLFSTIPYFKKQGFGSRWSPHNALKGRKAELKLFGSMDDGKQGTSSRSH
ncbi:hypothetical protein HN51_014319 [Arachis hypogaea]